jgi:hypothetical protein
MQKRLVPVAFACLAAALPSAQVLPLSPTVVVLKPARVFDGEAMHEGWGVRVKGDRIEAVGSETSLAAPGARVVDLRERR